ncbi:related to FMC1 - mitochondrial matrix protein, required for assembly of F1F0 ATP synthase [Ustilago bromivora]|uniref:Related to FMC1 - mitochondrial matrix protein, required for assembly of F1F0 ATP synthase n=1 Tax=Ustilago bromivora TaxID=307758 RepID=A0A8H8QI61_9BASI|nr:related to FMC1 - mitochondrial matrix protein, required for assembly of F1F0 ATP synthase [Ustilago bromivora]
MSAKVSQRTHTCYPSKSRSSTPHGLSRQDVRDNKKGFGCQDTVSECAEGGGALGKDLHDDQASKDRPVTNPIRSLLYVYTRKGKEWAARISSAEFRQQNLENLHVFLKNKALHAELLQRYNPTTGMTEEERIRLTARRVGLDVPITHDASAESANNYRKSAQIAQDQYKQDKDNREDQLYSGKGDGLNVGGPLRPPVFKE